MAALAGATVAMNIVALWAAAKRNERLG